MQTIKVNNKQYQVVPHWFWKQYNETGWEQQTYNVFERYIDKDTTYVDIGAWLGVTLFYADQFTEQPMFGVEANPLSYDMLCENTKSLDSIKITKCCITDVDYKLVGFGGKDNQRNTSSNSSINGNCWNIESRTLMSYLNENNLLTHKKLFIKVDIEGAEELILNDLATLRYLRGITVYLSIHPPFIKDKRVFCRDLLRFCYEFNSVLNSNMKELSLDRLENMIMTEIPYPSWGTKWGNFFEIVLTNKDVK